MTAGSQTRALLEHVHGGVCLLLACSMLSLLQLAAVVALYGTLMTCDLRILTLAPAMASPERAVNS